MSETVIAGMPLVTDSRLPRDVFALVGVETAVVCTADGRIVPMTRDAFNALLRQREVGR